MSAVSVLLESSNDRHGANRLPVEDKAVPSAPDLPVIRAIANVRLKGRDDASALDGQILEPVLNGHDALARVEVESIREPVVGIDVIETEPVQG